MDKETEEYFNTYFDLFRNDGWKLLVKELTANAMHINNVQVVKDADDMHFRKGQLDTLASIINLENTINTSYSEAKDDD